MRGNGRVGGDAPVVDEVTPVVDEVTPVVDGAAPVIDGAAPVIDGAAPVARGTAPTLESGARSAAPTPAAPRGESGSTPAASATTGTAGARMRRARPAPTEAERADAALELARTRDRIDELDRRIVELLNERAAMGRTAGRAKQIAGRRAVRDPEREREVLLRVAMANPGPLSQADLLSIYRRIVAATRGMESRDRTRDDRSGA